MLVQVSKNLRFFYFSKKKKIVTLQKIVIRNF